MKITPEMSATEIVDTMINIGSDEKQARNFLSRFIDVAVAHPNNAGCTRDVVVKRVQRNLGYIVGYAPTRIDVEMWRRIGVSGASGLTAVRRCN